MTHEYSHACFQLGVVAGVALTFAISAVFGWIFIALVERDWTGDGRTDR